ncbi:Aspartic peptidase, active site [Sesbania bispinosa]|nr:Aspartic peptidase, active site [Sesbania bispinosa]
MWDGYNITEDKSQPLKTLKLEGFVNGIPILILVDSGATHNFISPKVVKALGISVEKADKGLGHSIGRWISSISPKEYVRNWRTLGDVTANWETMTMTFASRDKEVKLHGYDSQRFAAYTV